LGDGLRDLVVVDVAVVGTVDGQAETVVIVRIHGGDVRAQADVEVGGDARLRKHIEQQGKQEVPYRLFQND
jgi:hypothetical protein